MSNEPIKTETIESCIINMLAPGSTKKNTEIKLINENDKQHFILIHSNPVASPELKDIELEVKERIEIGPLYNTHETKVKVKNGIITVTVPVNTEKVKIIEIEE